MRLEWTIPHPRREWFTLTANLPFPYSVTVLGNDDFQIVRGERSHALAVSTRAGQNEDARLRPGDTLLEMWIAVKGRPSTRAAF